MTTTPDQASEPDWVILDRNEVKRDLERARAQALEDAGTYLLAIKNILQRMAIRDQRHYDAKWVDGYSHALDEFEAQLDNLMVEPLPEVGGADAAEAIRKLEVGK